jgi:hypothetical protein
MIQLRFSAGNFTQCRNRDKTSQFTRAEDSGTDDPLSIENSDISMQIGQNQNNSSIDLNRTRL